MKYRVIERKRKTGEVKYFIEQYDDETRDWYVIMDENDEVLIFGELEEAKEFVEHLREIDEVLEAEENVVYEL